MKKIAFILLFIIISFSCNDEGSNTKPACGVENPVKDLSWLKNEIDQMEISGYEYSYIKQNIFEKHDVFIYGNCDPKVDYVPLIYNCNGEVIGYAGDGKYPSDLLTKGTVIWKSKNSKCNL